MEEHEDGTSENGGQETEQLPLSDSDDRERGVAQRVTIRATKDLYPTYFADIDLTATWSNDGRSLSFRTHRYMAFKNDRYKGNLSLHAHGVTDWNPKWDEIGRQDGQWNTHDYSGAVQVSNGQVPISWYWRYDQAATDVTLLGYHTFRYQPPHLLIGGPSGVVPERTFFVMGSGAVDTTAGIIVRDVDDSNRAFDGRVLSPQGDWSAEVSIAAGRSSLTFVAIQIFNASGSEPSNPSTVQLLTKPSITVPKDNDVISVPRPTVEGTGHNSATIKIYEADSGAVLYGSGTVTGGQWSIPLTVSLPNRAFVFHAEQTYVGLVTWSNKVRVTVQFPPERPVITSPAAGTEHDRTFRMSGIGGVAGALMEILLDTDHSIKFGQAPVTGDSWNVDVTLDAPGRRSLVARQTKDTLPSLSLPHSLDIRPVALAKVDISFPSASSIEFAGVSPDGTAVEIRKISGPDVPMPADAPVVNGTWKTSVSGWSYGVYQLEAITKVSNGAGGWVKGRPFAFMVTYAVPIPFNASSNTDYQPTLTGKGVLNGVVSFFDPDLSTKIAPDATVNASDIWSSRVSSLWGPTWQRKVHIRQTINGQHSAFIVHNVDIPPLAPVIDAVEKESLTPLITGKCWNSARVQLEFDNDGRKLDATVNVESWTYRRSEPFESGTTHTVKVTQIAAQQTSPAATETFTVERPMIVPGLIFPGETEKVGRNLRVRGSGGMKGAIVILYDARFGNELGRSAGPLPEDGEWIIELKTLSFRLYTVEVMQKIGDRESARSEWSTFTVQLQTFFTQPLPGRTRTRDAEFEGLGLEGGRVDLFLGDALEPFARNVLVGAGGDWRVTALLDVGVATVRARQSFEAEVSEATVTFRVVPNAAFIETPAAGEHIGGRTVVSGFGVAGDTVTVMLGGAASTVLAETTVEGDGTWSVEVYIAHPGGDVDLVVVSSLGDFVSDASPARPVTLGTYSPGIELPSEGTSVSNPVHFAGPGKVGEGTLWQWFNPEEKLPSNIPVTDAGWSVEAESELSVGGSWVGFCQTLKDDPDGATFSDRVSSARFEVDSADAISRFHKKSDKR